MWGRKINEQILHSNQPTKEERTQTFPITRMDTHKMKIQSLHKRYIKKYPPLNPLDDFHCQFICIFSWNCSSCFLSVFVSEWIFPFPLFLNEERSSPWQLRLWYSTQTTIIKHHSLTITAQTNIRTLLKSDQTSPGQYKASYFTDYSFHLHSYSLYENFSEVQSKNCPTAWAVQGSWDSAAIQWTKGLTWNTIS